MKENKLLELRKRIKAKKPDFIRSDSHKVKRLGPAWRQPRGMHSKVRRKFKGKRAMPSMGYSSPRKVRGLHGSGMEYKVVRNLSELTNIGKGMAIILAKNLGAKKKFEIIKKALELKLTMLNIKKPEEFIKKVEEAQKAKKEEQKKKEEKKEKTREETIKKAEEKEKKEKDELAEKIESEEPTKKEKSEAIKVLEKKR